MLLTADSGERQGENMLDFPVPATASPEDVAALKQAIVKLRWIGMEDDAETLISVLAERAPHECVPIESLCTD